MISKINFYYLLSAIFLFAFATFIPTIYPLHADSNEIPAIEQIYLPESKSKLGYIILSTDINNENSNKKLSDFIVNITGSYEDPTFLHAVQSPQIQIIPIIEGYYKISINDVEDFEIFLGERCEGILNSGEVKSCQISADYIEEIDNLSFDNKASRSSTSLFELLSPSDILENDQKNRFEIAQIPKPSDTSKVGFLILSTKVVNNNGGNKQPSDFIINIDGTAAFPSSFKAAPSNLLQVVSINQGQYSISVNGVPGYKANFELQCSGQIDKGQIKSCLINLDDIDTPISCTAGQHFDTTTNSCVPDTPQPPVTCTAGQHFDTTTNSCVPDTPQPPVTCTAGQHFDTTTNSCVPDTPQPPVTCTAGQHFDTTTK
ncbi:MAG: hypothetical protein MRJ93_11540 [Nitrososphaeraceae archaeon]|nr:hypothetical protein [Nitrososphaeraceae archaeon]